ncbi:MULTISPECIES: hypothetical protein [Phyllobacteriaceae]|jgi:hypothetical protein|nr:MULTISPECIES: hypothetical protein [Mesorhizobium]MDQ0330653.1 hypothetical protein [Mesorhizobium sp. YL-MeA3-2017]
MQGWNAVLQFVEGCLLRLPLLAAASIANMKTQANPANEFLKPWPLHGWRSDLAFAAGAAMLLVAIEACIGFPTLTNAGGDNDSQMRLVEVRDLLSGQGWFDLHQYRMGPQGGFIMHWSRLVDAPLAALITTAHALGLSMPAAETFAKIVWPTLMCWWTVFFIVQAARQYGGNAAGVPALVIAAAGPFFIGLYQPGNIDHHNVQLMLVAASLYFLLNAPHWRPAATLSGVCAGLTLAVGMETAPLVVVTGLGVAALFFMHGEREARTAFGFGLGFAGVSSVIFVTTIAPSNWNVATCDGFSVIQFVLAALAGFGLAATASVGSVRASRSYRLVALLLLGIVVVTVVAVFFPQCLRSPYAGLDPRLHTLWLDKISEVQSLFQLATDNRAMLFGAYATPLIALALVLRRLLRGDRRREVFVVGVLLLTALTISVWQVRGTNFTIALAAIPLAAWVASWREYATNFPSAKTTLASVAVWLVSLNAVWSVSASTISVIAESETSPVAGQSCETPGDYLALAAQPATTVMAISNLGSLILANTGQRVLAGPYHRNGEGNLLVLDAFTGTSTAAEAVVRGQHIGLVALCRGNSETRFLAGQSPDGFLAALIKGQVPSWLEPVAGTEGKALELYRVRTG